MGTGIYGAIPVCFSFKARNRYSCEEKKEGKAVAGYTAMSHPPVKSVKVVLSL
ncbi:MAG: hypothetical protein LBS12_01550 [Prevotellaceae bacterium]|jgi:hypothetical protein|nr:hypothetical protein [Prevotellaceae bacterium]